MNIIDKNAQDELIVNKSKFITYAYKVNNIDEVNNILNDIKKEYKDATHICYAYQVKNAKKAYDDGEPTHTAGMPILNIIEKNDLDNILIIIVRYFGGIKLGASNLTRTYLNAAINVLEKTNIVPMIKEYKIKIEFDYQYVNEINYILKDYNITYKEFNTNVIYEFIYNENNYPSKIDSYIITKENI